MNNEDAKWLVVGRTGYTLIHHGWLKGEEQFRNQYSFSLQYDYKTVTEAEAEEKAAFIVKAVNCHEQLVRSAKSALAIIEREVADGEYTEEAASLRIALAAAGVK